MNQQRILENQKNKTKKNLGSSLFFVINKFLNQIETFDNNYNGNSRPFSKDAVTNIRQFWINLKHLKQ